MFYTPPLDLRNLGGFGGDVHLLGSSGAGIIEKKEFLIIA